MCVFEPPRHSKLLPVILGPGKHLIGSDPACAVHFEAEGVQQRHALLIVGPQKTVLRALDPRTWVNDSAIDETVLRLGDRVSIGPMTFRLRAATADEASEFQQPAVEKSVSSPFTVMAEDSPSKAAQANQTDREPVPATAAKSPLQGTFAGGLSDDDKSASIFDEEPRSINASVDFPAQPVTDEGPVPDDGAIAVADSEIPDPKKTIESPSHGSEQQANIGGTDKEQISPLAATPLSETLAARGNDETQRGSRPLATPAIESVSDCELSDGGASVDSTLEAWQEQLLQLATELDCRSRELQRHASQVAKREAELKRKQAQLTSEPATAAIPTQHERADEHARQVATWNEWNEARRRSAEEFNEQLALLEQHRTEIQTASEQADRDRVEIQYLQNECAIAQSELAADWDRLDSERETLRAQAAEIQEQRKTLDDEFRDREARIEEDRRSVILDQEQLLADRQQLEQEFARLADERDKLASERESLRIQTAEFETLRQQQSLDVRNREAQIDEERRTLVATQRDLLATRKQIELDRSRLAADRTADSARRELERRELLDARSQLNDDQEVIRKTRIDLEAEKRLLEEQRIDLIRQRDQFDAERAEAQTIRSRFEQTTIGRGPVCGPVHSTGSSNANEVLATSSRSDFPSNHLELTGQTVGTAGLASRVGEAPTATKTLSVVNQQFGSLVQTTDPDLNSLQSLESQTLTAADQAVVRISEADAAHSFIDEPVPAYLKPPSVPAADDTISSLRAQLAQLFELTDGAAPRYESLESPDDGRLEDNDHQIPTPDVVDSAGECLIEPLSVDDETIDAPEINQTLHANVFPADADREVTAADKKAGATNEIPSEDPWTRRLHELSRVASGPTATPPPAPPPIPEINGSEPDEPLTDDDDDEYSVEAQLARLLGRPKNSARAIDEGITELQSTSVAKRDVFTATSDSTPKVEDRSHLTEEPKHKQDKSAVREEVQSFRAVAQISARTALAKHSWGHLRNKIVFRIGLTSFSAAATVWFGAAYFYGVEKHAWIGLACGAVTIACLYSMVRTSSQLNKWRRKHPGESDTSKSPTPETNATGQT